MKKIAAIPALVLMLAGCSTLDSQVEDAKKLTKEHFRNTATLQDDSLDTVATITTVNGLQLKNGLLGVVGDDNFLRAFIDKKTGQVTYQFYQALRYRDSGWRYYNRINYKTVEGVQSTPATIISRNVDCTDSQYGGCNYEENVAIILDEKVLRMFASIYNPTKPAGLMFKIASKSGVEYSDGMLVSEIAGLLERVDAYRSANGFSKPD